MSITLKLPSIYSFLILSNPVTLYIHLNIRISATFIFILSFLFNAHRSSPYVLAVLYNFPFNYNILTLHFTQPFYLT